MQISAESRQALSAFNERNFNTIKELIAQKPTTVTGMLKQAEGIASKEMFTNDPRIVGAMLDLYNNNRLLYSLVRLKSREIYQKHSLSNNP